MIPIKLLTLLKSYIQQREQLVFTYGIALSDKISVSILCTM